MTSRTSCRSNPWSGSKYLFANDAFNTHIQSVGQAFGGMAVEREQTRKGLPEPLKEGITQSGQTLLFQGKVLHGYLTRNAKCHYSSNVLCARTYPSFLASTRLNW